MLATPLADMMPTQAYETALHEHTPSDAERKVHPLGGNAVFLESPGKLYYLWLRLPVGTKICLSIGV